VGDVTFVVGADADGELLVAFVSADAYKEHPAMARQVIIAGNDFFILNSFGGQ
jgi:hypothetical protein